jgi:hypothetical protein
MTRTLLFLAALSAAPLALAQISTDRPGLGFNPSVVDQGTFQIEAGLPQASRSSGLIGPVDATFANYGFPVLLRYGLTPQVELRLGSSVYDIASVSSDAAGADGSESSPGLDVIEAGAKIQLVTNGPVVSILPSVLIPTTDAGDLAGAFRTVAGWTLTPQFGLTTVLGAVVSDADVTAEAIAVVGTALTDAVSAYAEVGTFPGDDATPILAGGGVALLVTPDLQLDASFDFGLNDDAPDLLFGAGASIRF